MPTFNDNFSLYDAGVFVGVIADGLRSVIDFFSMSTKQVFELLLPDSSLLDKILDLISSIPFTGAFFNTPIYIVMFGTGLAFFFVLKLVQLFADFAD